MGWYVTLDAEDVDSDDPHSTSTTTSRFTAITTGWYGAGAHGVWTTNRTNATAPAIRLTKHGARVSSTNVLAPTAVGTSA